MHSPSGWDILLRAPTAIITTSAAGIIQFANHAALALLAYDMEALRGRSFARIVVERARPRCVALWAQYAAGLAGGPGHAPGAPARPLSGEPRVIDFALGCLCGDAREIDIYLSLDHHARGDAEPVVIAALRPAGAVPAREQALRDRLEALETMIDYVPIGLYEARPDATPATVFVNPGVADQGGHPPEDILRDPTFWSRHLHPDERASVFQQAEQAYRAGEGSYEYRFLQKDGSYRWLRDALRVVPGAGDRPPRIIGCCMDITERKQAEQALAAAEAHTRALLDAMPDMMFRVHRDGTMLGYKAEAAQLLLIAPDQVVGCNLRDVPLPADAIESLMSAIAGVVETGAPRQVEFDMLDRGQLRCFEVRICRCAADEVVMISRDITERTRVDRHIRELNQRLEQQNRELEWFSYSVSHDLRAPLRAIDGFSTALLEDHGDRLDGSGRELLHRVCSAARHMGQLIDGLLGLAHVSRSELCREQLDLSALAHEIAGALGAAEPAREVRWLVAPGVTGYGDRRLLRILLDNVLGNAWKYTAHRADACIELGALDRAGTRVYFVRDNGVGFDMAHMQGLFQPFHRLHSAREFAGTGIGLATAVRVLERHGGRMWAEAAVGEGATFYFTLSP